MMNKLMLLSLPMQAAVASSVASGDASLVASSDRMISWWFDVGGRSDAANLQVVKDHTSVFSRAQVCNDNLKLDGNLTEWWYVGERVSRENETTRSEATSNVATFRRFAPRWSLSVLLSFL